MIRKAGSIAVLLFLSPVLVPLAALFVVFALCVSVYHWLWLLYFCWTHVGREYLICSRRRGWEPFLQNNLVPILPEQISTVWIEAAKPTADVLHAGRIANVFFAKPFLIRVTRFRLLSVSLNPLLANPKCHGAVSESVRVEARRVVETALEGMGDA